MTPPQCASVLFSRSLLKITRVLASFNKSKGAWDSGIFRIVADSRTSRNNTADRKLENQEYQWMTAETQLSCKSPHSQCYDDDDDGVNLK